MVARQRREPQRQLGEIDGERVLVDAVEAALRDETAGMQLLVLVGRNGRLLLRPARPGLDQPFAASARQASTRKAPEPMAGSQTFRSRICSGVASGPSRSNAGSSACCTIGSVRLRGV